MFRSLVLRAFRPVGHIQNVARFSTEPEPEPNPFKDDTMPLFGTEPIMVSRSLEFPCKDGRSRKAWIENIDTVSERKLGLVDLHPEVFAVPPRLDILWQNLRWQQNYRTVNKVQVNTRKEMRGGGRKPWPQKGLGKARQGSIRAPQWYNGGMAHGPRAPTTKFYMLPLHTRLFGLRCALSAKLAQDDLHIVNSLELPTDDPAFLEELVDSRLWGPSVLFIDDTDVAPDNIAIVTEEIDHFNLLPVYGLNVYSMLKHDTLVLTLAALEKIEKQILFFMNRTDKRKFCEKLKFSQV